MLKAQKKFEEAKKRELTFTQQYGHARLPMFLRLKKGELLLAVGNQLLKKTREGPDDFLTILHDHALLFFGVPFLEAQEAMPFEERHPAIKWLHLAVEFNEKRRTDPAAAAAYAKGTGSGAAWMRLAYDLFTIKDNSELKDRLKDRLLDPVGFQGARHELKVAAMCIGAGFKLEFEDDTDTSTTHFEFVATDASGLQIAVEAKSKHRRDVHDFKGGAYRPPGEKVDIRTLVTDAYLKKTSLPLYVFIDVNLPPRDSRETFERWLMEIYETMMDLAAEGYTDPCPANAVFFMNDPSHYLSGKPLGNDDSNLWWKDYVAEKPRAAHPKRDMVELFSQSIRQRAVPPVEFINGLLATGGTA